MVDGMVKKVLKENLRLMVPSARRDHGITSPKELSVYLGIPRMSIISELTAGDKEYEDKLKEL